MLYTLPLILTGILQLLYSAADSIIVGRFAGSNSLAAVGSTISLINLLTNLFIGLSTGTSACIAHFIGANDDKAVQKTVHTSIAIAAIGGIFLTILGLFFSGTCLKLMDTPSDIIDEATLYMQIIFVGMPLSMLYNFGSGILRAVGDTKTPLIFLSVSGVINIVLNLILVIVFHMGAAGVGIATITSQLVSSYLIIRFLCKTDAVYKLHPTKLRIHSQVLVRILKIGIPAGIQGVIFSISNVLIQSSVNQFGSRVIAGNSAATNLEDFCYIAVNAMHQSILTFVGQSIGARQFNRLKKIIATGIVQVITIGVIISGFILIFSESLLGLYIHDDVEALSYGLQRFYITLPLYALYGVMEALTGALRGMGSSFIPMCISIACICGVRITWIYTIFAKIHTLNYLYLSYPVSWIITVLLQGCFCFIVLKRILKQNNGIVYTANK